MEPDPDADLRAAVNVKLDLIICRMYRLGVSQDRIAGRLGAPRETVRDHLAKTPELANPPIADLKRGFMAPQVAEKHACPVGPEDRTGGWPEPLVWSIALEGKDDLNRFKSLSWGLRTWDLWNWNDCLPR